MNNNFIKISSIILSVLCMLVPSLSFAITSNFSADSLVPKVEIFTTPKQGEFQIGSDFDVPIYINTRDSSVNTISLKINFDPSRLSIINSPEGKSAFGIWVESPEYDNIIGTVSMTVVIPGGVVTNSGLVATLRFKATASGEALVSISDLTSVNLNDGLGSEALVVNGSSKYILKSPLPNSVLIASETHVIQDKWYNNNSPTFTWEKGENVEGFSVAFDKKPNTNPANKITDRDPAKHFEDVNDGISYFHVKPFAKDAWGPTSHFQIKIDTGMPSEFKPEASSFADDADKDRFMISFFTTDEISGIDRYEVGIINKKSSSNSSPVFVQSESPLIVPADIYLNSRALVRVFDKAGNMREEYVDIYPGISVINFIKKNGLYFALFVVFLLLLELIIHYLFGHHMLGRIKSALSYFKKHK